MSKHSTHSEQNGTDQQDLVRPVEWRVIPAAVRSARPTRPALRYHGGKWRDAGWIISHFPTHTCYVEPFGGGANVMLQKAPSPTEVYNDRCGEVVNFFRVLRTQKERLVEQVRLTPWSREEYRLSYEWHPDAVERARRFFVRSWQGVGGVKSDNLRGWRYVTAQRDATIPRRFLDLSDLQATAERLQGVQIENDDWSAVLSRYDGSETLFYVDPPYVANTRSKSHQKAYAFEMDDSDHEALLRQLCSVEGMVVLSGYDCDLYADYVGDWNRVEKKGRTSADSTEATEVLWFNEAAQANQQQPSLFRIQQKAV